MDPAPSGAWILPPETTAATILVTAAHFGTPVSTTHAVTTSIMGVGCAKGFNHMKFWTWSNASSGPGS